MAKTPPIVGRFPPGQVILKVQGAANFRRLVRLQFEVDMRHLFRSSANRGLRQRRQLRIEGLELRLAMHGSTAGLVYIDADANGVKDAAETGIPGVVVRLTGTETGGAAVDKTDITDDAGAYSFVELNPGTYQLAERQPIAFGDGPDVTSLTTATITNDTFASFTLAEDQASTLNNFAESFLLPEFVSIRMFLASTPPVAQLLRETNARVEDAAGNTELAASIRAGSSDVPADGDDNNPTPNAPFSAVTTGEFDAAGLLGTRTDLVSGAPPITRDHLSTAIDYSLYSNPPTYGPHHPPISDASGSITPRPTGVYTTAQPDEDLVHNLEHGHVWISYNPSLISATDLAALTAMVNDGGTNAGVIVTPRPQDTTAIAVASWAHLLTLSSFDAAQIRAFIETNRGHAPEGFIPSGQKTAASETVDDALLHTSKPVAAFAAVTTGAFDAANLKGTRTDLVSGAPAITQTHLTTAIDYSDYSNPPSYGPHHGPIFDDDGGSITPRPTGIYTTEQPDEDLVHNLEHGHVWISYNPQSISATDKAALEAFVTAGGTNNGVIVTPRAANTSAIVLTSWAHQTSLTSFNATTIRDFIETNRGHAPEGFIPSGQKTAESETLDDDFDHLL
jgi:hypothetical protein